MSQAIIEHVTIRTQVETRQWLLVGLFSLMLHTSLVLWFSSRTPDFPTANFSDFKVGLISSEGMGETLQASLPNIAAVSDVDTEESSLVTQQEAVSDALQKQALEITEQLPPIEQVSIENVELAAVVTPETSLVPDVPPPAISDAAKALENKIEESRPVEAVEIIIPSAVSVESDATETIGISADLINIDPINDFFKPADVLIADDPMMALPIELLTAVPAPDAIKPDINPDLASDDVEILEIRARDVLAKREPESTAQQLPAKPAVQTGTGEDPLHPGQSPFAIAGESSTKKVKPPVVQEQDEPSSLPSVIVPEAYILELKSLLSRYKTYPELAHRLKQEGVVVMGLVIDRRGKLISYAIKRSSGHKLLDQEVEIMIQRAAKIMPALPDNFPRDTLELLVPVRFKVKP